MSNKPSPLTHDLSTMAASSSDIGLRRRGLLSLSLVAVLAAIALGAFLWEAIELSSFNAVSERVDRLQPPLTGLRFVLIGLLAVVWPRLSPLGLHADVDNEASRARWMALRWRVIGWLLVVEFIVGQNLFGRLVNAGVHP